MFQFAFVTGATSGIGAAVCELLASKGIALLATGRDMSRLQQLQQQLRTQVSVQILSADLAKAEDRAKIIQWIHQEKPDLIINNAGFGLYGEALSYSTEEQVKILEVNGKAVLEITLEAARTMKTFGKKGVILNVSSAAGFQVLSYSAVYAASKAFVNSFSQALDFEYCFDGIRILTICPGMVETNFQQRAGGQRQPQERGVMTSQFVAEKIWQQIQTGQSIQIINWKYRLINFISSFIPTHFIAVFSKKIFSARIKPRNFMAIDRTYDN